MAWAVNSAGAEAKAARIQALVAQKVADTMPEVALQVATDAALRAPTVDEEYTALMGEESDVPRAGDRSGDADDRIRLMKPEDTYLQNAVINPGNLGSDATTASVGNVAFLETQATYKYVNERRISKDEYEQSEEYEVGPYFDAVEYGGSAIIVPVFTLANGHKYPLRPHQNSADDKDNYQMEKSFAPHNMFAPFVLLAKAREIITTALAGLNGA